MLPTRAILLSRLLTHGGDQAWDFAVPLALVVIFPQSLDRIALYFLLVRLGHTALVARVCAWSDGRDRLATVRAGIGMQTAAVALGWIGLQLLAARGAFDAPLFAAVVAAGILGSLGAALMDVAVSQDWLPSVVPPQDLAPTNASLRQIDLLTELGAPVLAGLLLTLSSSAIPLLGLSLVALWNAASFVPEYLLLARVYRSDTTLAVKPPPPILASLAEGWREFRAQPAAVPIVAYAMLWLTVISPHGVLLTAWLKTAWQLPETAIGVFRGLGAVFGLLATLLFPIAARRFGVVQGARAFIVWQAACLVAAGVAFAQGAGAAPVFVALVLLSRIGLYGFSLGEMEIRQRTVAPAVRGRVNGVANAITSLATLAVYGAGTLLRDPSDFSVLIYGSIAAVVLGAATFTVWSLRAAAMRLP